MRPTFLQRITGDRGLQQVKGKPADDDAEANAQPRHWQEWRGEEETVCSGYNGDTGGSHDWHGAASGSRDTWSDGWSGGWSSRSDWSAGDSDAAWMRAVEDELAERGHWTSLQAEALVAVQAIAFRWQLRR